MEKRITALNRRFASANCANCGATRTREQQGRRRRAAMVFDFRNKRRRRVPSPEDRGDAGGANGNSQPAAFSFTETMRAMFNLKSNSSVYNMQKPGEKERLADDLWKGVEHQSNTLSSANPDLNKLLNLQAMDDVQRDRGFADRQRGAVSPRFENVFAAIFRSRSKFLVPIGTAALAVRFAHHSIPRTVWDSVAYYSPGAVMSRAWTSEFMEVASLRDPGSPYKTVPGITACCFDNYSIHSNYGSFATVESSGEPIDMVNWASISIPAVAAPPGFDFNSILGNGGIFRTDLSRAAFLDGFSPNNLEIQRQKNRRWCAFLDAAANGTFGDKPKYNSPYPPTHVTHQQPVWDQGNAKYDDINFQTNWFRRSPLHRWAMLMFLGGDGLSFMRLIHRIAQDPTFFLNTTPLIIPVLGEHPHGTYHVMDGGWKQWYPFIEVTTNLLNNRQIIARPPVSAFNNHEKFLVHVIGRACAEYVAEISATGTDYHMPQRLISQADKNFSFSIIVHFLYDYVFLYMQFRNAVRTNSSDELDVCWREFLTSARSDLGNKTNYSQLSIVRVYWGVALVPQLALLYRNIRTLRLKDTHVGWDMFIEKMNLDIARGCTSHITKESIARFISNLSFTKKVNATLEATVHAGWNEVVRLKKMRADVDAIKEHLRDKVGRTYAQATTPSTENTLDIDLSNWGGSIAARHMARRPWQQAATSMLDYRDYVDRQLNKLCHWHQWAP